MQTIIDAAAQIASEIEKTRVHLEKLQQALDGLRPLIVVDSSPNVLSYTAVSDIQTVEDVLVVSPVAGKTAARKAKPAAKPPKAPKAAAKTAKSKVAKKPRKTTVAGTTTKAKTSSAAEAAKEQLPKTGNAIWLKALGRKKLTQNQLTSGTLSLLKLGDEARAAIHNRAGAWLNAAVKKNQVTAATNRAGLKVYEAAQA